jgi:hypothetical protein
MDLHEPVSERDHLRGASGAPTTLVEYGDFDCPFCAQAYPVVRELLQRFDKQLCFVFRHNPRGELHPHARLAAQAAESAALQGRFWAMHDTLFEHRNALEEQALISYANQLHLNIDQFTEGLRSPAVVARVRQDEVGGLRSGVIGTPTFFINGVHFRDKPDFETLAQAIESAGRANHDVRTEAKEKAHAQPTARAKAMPFRRRDGSGHLDPKYEALLLRESGRSRTPDDDRAFLNGPHSSDSLAEQLGEEFLQTATSGEYEAEDVLDQVVPEENGGPFVETSASTEFAHGTDASNIKDATREPFPKT